MDIYALLIASVRFDLLYGHRSCGMPVLGMSRSARNATLASTSLSIENV